MQWRQKRRSSWISYKTTTTCSIASNSGRFAWSRVEVGEGSNWGWQHFYCVIFLIKNVLTSVRLFYSHTTYMPINYIQLVAGMLALRGTLSYIFALSMVWGGENDISVMRVSGSLPWPMTLVGKPVHCSADCCSQNCQTGIQASL